MSDKDNLISLSDKVKQKQDDLRREYERFLFNKVLGCYSVVEKLGLKPIDVVDISKAGASFRLSEKEGSFGVGEELDLRFYFSNKNYVTCPVKVTRVQKSQNAFGAEFQYGCVFETETKAYAVIQKFVDFIEAFSEQAKEDKGGSPILYF